jgi:mediator of RNA polymerase II transcription subunit 21
MATHPVDEDLIDDDLTDELPVLGEADIAAAEDTGRFDMREAGAATARFPAPGIEHNGDDTIIALRSDLAERNARVESLQADFDGLRDRWGDIETTLKDREERILELETELQTIANAVDDSDERRLDLETQLDEQQLTLEQVRTDAADAATRRDAFSHDLDGVTRQLTEAHDAIAGVRDELTAAQQALEEQQKHSDASKQSVEDSESSLQDLAKQLADQREQVATLSQYIEGRRTDWDAQNQTVAVQDERIAELEQEVGQRTKQTQAVERRVEQSQLTHEKLRTDLESKNRELHSLRQRTGELDNQLGEHRSLVQASTSETELLVQRNEGQDREIQDLTASLADKAQALTALETDLAEQHEQLGSLQQELDGEREQLTERDHSFSTEQATRQSLQEGIDQLEQELCEARTALAAREDSFSELETEQQANSAAHAEERQRFGEELSEHAEMMGHLEAELENQRARNAALTESQTNGEADRKVLVERTKELEDVVQTKQDEFLRLQEVVETHGQLREDLSIANAKTDELQQALDALQEQLDRTNGEIKEKDNLNAEMGRLLERRAKEYDALESRLDNLNDIGESIQELDAQMSERIGDNGRATKRLLILTGEDREVRYPLYKDAMIIGRTSHCDIQIRAHYVSREHARVETQDDLVFVEDLGSKNGIFVNAVRTERHELTPGDVLTVGETQFRYTET